MLKTLYKHLEQLKEEQRALPLINQMLANLDFVMKVCSFENKECGHIIPQPAANSVTAVCESCTIHSESCSEQKD